LRAARTRDLQWLSDGSAAIAVELTRAFAAFHPGQNNSAFEVRPDGFDRRYFTGGALVDDRTLAIAVENTGVLLADFRPTT